MIKLILIFFSLCYGQEEDKWFISQNLPVRGVAFIVHGLNSKPSTMDFLANTLQRKGLHVLRGAIAFDAPTTSHKIWLDRFNKIYLEALAQALKLKVPLYFFGYSLGALLFLDFLYNSPENIRVEKAVFLSPALKIASHLRFFSFIFYLPGNWKLPSRNLPEYRSNDYTSFSAYKSLWISYGRIDWKKIVPPKSLILLDRKDELIAFNDTIKLVKKFPQWELFEVDTSGSRNSREYHHLTFNQNCYQEGKWEIIEKKIEDFLNLHY